MSSGTVAEAVSRLDAMRSVLESQAALCVRPTPGQVETYRREIAGAVTLACERGLSFSDASTMVREHIGYVEELEKLLRADARARSTTT